MAANHRDVSAGSGHYAKGGGPGVRSGGQGRECWEVARTPIRLGPIHPRNRAERGRSSRERFLGKILVSDFSAFGGGNGPGQTQQRPAERLDGQSESDRGAGWRQECQLLPVWREWQLRHNSRRLRLHLKLLHSLRAWPQNWRTLALPVYLADFFVAGLCPAPHPTHPNQQNRTDPEHKTEMFCLA